MFASLSQPAQPVAARRGGKWWLAFVLTAAIPALTFYPLMKLGVFFFPMQLFPQSIQNQLIVWALINALITLVLGLALRGGKPVFTTDWPKSAAIAMATVAVGYLSLVLVDAVFKVDYRFWVLGLKPLDGRHALMAIPYLVLWAVFFLVALRALAANLAVKGEGFLMQTGGWKIAMCLGFIVLLMVRVRDAVPHGPAVHAERAFEFDRRDPVRASSGGRGRRRGGDLPAHQLLRPGRADLRPVTQLVCDGRHSNALVPGIQIASSGGALAIGLRRTYLR